MRIHAFTLLGACVFLGCCLPAFGQMAQNNPSIHGTKASTDMDDTVAILEVGAATNWNFSGGAATFAPNLAPTLGEQTDSVLSGVLELSPGEIADLKAKGAVV